MKEKTVVNPNLRRRRYFFGEKAPVLLNLIYYNKTGRYREYNLTPEQFLRRWGWD